MQNDHLQARHAKKKKDRTTEFGVKFDSAQWSIEGVKEILKRMNYWAAGLHNAVDGARNCEAPERSWIQSK